MVLLDGLIITREGGGCNALQLRLPASRQSFQSLITKPLMHHLDKL